MSGNLHERGWVTFIQRVFAPSEKAHQPKHFFYNGFAPSEQAKRPKTFILPCLRAIGQGETAQRTQSYAQNDFGRPENSSSCWRPAAAGQRHGQSAKVSTGVAQSYFRRPKIILRRAGAPRRLAEGMANAQKSRLELRRSIFGARK